MKNINVNFLELKGTSYDIGKQLGLSLIHI